MIWFVIKFILFAVKTAPVELEYNSSTLR